MSGKPPGRHLVELPGGAGIDDQRVDAGQHLPGHGFQPVIRNVGQRVLHERVAPDPVQTEDVIDEFGMPRPAHRQFPGPADIVRGAGRRRVHAEAGRQCGHGSQLLAAVALEEKRQRRQPGRRGHWQRRSGMGFVIQFGPKRVQ